MNIDNYKHAFNNVSMDPEGRFYRFKKELLDNIKDATEYGKSIDLNDELIQNHLKKLIQSAYDYLSSMSNCASTFICGPANFPTRKMEKRNDWASKKLDKYCYYLDYKTCLKKKLPKETEDEKIIRWKDEITKYEQLQEVMKKANALIRKKDFEGLKKISFLTDKVIHRITTPNYLGNIGFEHWELSNNLKNIKRLKNQIKDSETTRENNKDESFTIGDCEIQHDSNEIRWNLFFPNKPSEQIRTTLKSNGFKWSPSRGSWTRQSKTMPKQRLVNILSPILI